jgi:hypothetical protein
MTEEQYKRAVEIGERLKGLNEVKYQIKDVTSTKLSYVNENSDGDYIAMPKWKMVSIVDILDKHDSMIRAEIDEEIEKLRKEIEQL